MDRQSSHHWDTNSSNRPMHVDHSDEPMKVETIDEDSQEYRVDQFGKAIVGTPGFGEFGLGPRSPAYSSKVVLDPEDMRILRECNAESFYRRCLPLALAGNILTFMYYQNKPPATGRRFWPYFGVTMAAWVGGKFSYRSKCEDKLINAGHRSALVDAIRKKRGIPESEFDADHSWQSSSSSSDWRTEDQQQNRQATSHFNEVSSSSLSSHGYDASSTTGNESERPSVTYDALRQQNRSRAIAPPSQDLSGRSRPTF